MVASLQRLKRGMNKDEHCSCKFCVFDQHTPCPYYLLKRFPQPITNNCNCCPTCRNKCESEGRVYVTPQLQKVVNELEKLENLKVD